MDLMDKDVLLRLQAHPETLQFVMKLTETEELGTNIGLAGTEVGQIARSTVACWYLAQDVGLGRR
jgi:hypothetical protein